MRTFITLTDRDVERIKEMYCSGVLYGEGLLSKYFDSQMNRPVKGFFYLPLMRTVKTMLYKKRNLGYIVLDEIKEAKRVSAALKDEHGNYYQVVVGVNVGGINHYFVGSEPIGERVGMHAPDRNHLLHMPLKDSQLIDAGELSKLRDSDDFIELGVPTRQISKAKLKSLRKQE